MNLLPMAGAIVLVAGGALAQAPAATLFENVMVFDGTSAELTGPSNVLVEGNRITRITDAPIAVDAATTTIAGDGRTLMPGLIDAHWHTMLVRPTPAEAIYGDLGFNNLVAGAEATDTLMRGFTTVRDMGGPAFGLKQAIDAGIAIGPRIYPSGAMITVTGGHGDFRQLSDLPRTVGGPPSRMEAIGGSMVADSPDEVRLRVREQLMLGASQIKLTAGGGVASPHSPLDVSTFTPEELRAATEAAGNWGTYVAVHAYTSEAIQRAIEAGVKVIEHGHLMDDATARMMAERGIWLSTQPFLDDEDAIPFPPGSDQAAKAQEVFTGTDNVYRLAKQYGIRTAFGTDTLFSKDWRTAKAPSSPSSRAGTRPPRPGDGDVGQRRPAAALRTAQPLPRPPRRGGGRSPRRPPAGRRQPTRGHRPDRRSGTKLPRHHEGRRGLQERPAALTIQS